LSTIRIYLAQELEVVLGAFLRGAGWISGERWRRALSMIGQGLAGGLEAHPVTAVPSAPFAYD